MESTFGVASASAVVRKVVTHDRPRCGHCDNGLKYFVHGIGYSVVFPSGATAHIDSGPHGDCFSVYDIAGFLNDDRLGIEVSVAEVTTACEDLVVSGVLRRVDATTLAFPQ